MDPLFNLSTTQQEFKIEKHPEDVPLLSSPQEFEAFLRSNIWKDISQVLNDRLEDARMGLEGAQTVDTMRLLQGNIAALRSTIELPAALAEEIKQTKDLERNNG